MIGGLKGRSRLIRGKNPVILIGVVVSVFVLGGSGQWFLGQWTKPGTLLPGLLLTGAFLCVLGFLYQEIPEKPEDRLPFPAEKWIFGAIFSVSIFLRLYRIDQVPAGINVDTSVIGLGGLRVLHEGWRPFFEDSFSTHPGLIYYLSAAWFSLLEPSRVHLLLFSAFLSILSLPFVYLAFRRISGPPTALAALGFLGSMRWDLASSRGFPLHDSIFFMFAALAFWLSGLKSGKKIHFFACAIFLSAGLYTYHGYKLFLLLMAIYGAYEYLENQKIKEKNGPLTLFACVGFLLMSPMFFHWIRAGNFGSYESSLFIGNEISSKKSLMPLWENLARLLEAFNRKGDSSAYLNFASEPMLDGCMGLFFIWGTWRALWGWRRRECFYPLAGLLVMGLNGLLAVDAGDTLARRLFGTVPFAAFLAGSGLIQALALIRLSWPFFRGVRGGFLAGGVLLFAGWLNFNGYFLSQANDCDYGRVSDLAATALGERISSEGDRFQFLIDPRYQGHRTVDFLGYFHRSDYQRMDWPKDLAPLSPSGKEGVCFALGEGKIGIFHLLQSLYPKANTSVVRDLNGNALIYFAEVGNLELERTHGLASTGNQTDKIFYHDFPLDLPEGSFQGSLAGNFFADESGPYFFKAQPGGSADIFVDGEVVHSGRRLSLIRGFHSLRVMIHKKSPGPIKILGQDPGHSEFELGSNQLTQLPLTRGLKADYFSGNSNAVIFSQWDPLINFSYRTNFAVFQPGERIDWKGHLRIDENGIYDFLLLTEPEDLKGLWLDGKSVIAKEGGGLGQARLKPGWHDLRLSFWSGPGFFSSLSLAWKKPGTGKYEVIPAGNFGEVKSPAR